MNFKLILILVIFLKLNSVFGTENDSLVFSANDQSELIYLNQMICYIHNSEKSTNSIEINQYDKGLNLVKKIEIPIDKSIGKYFKLKTYTFNNKLFLLYASRGLDRIQIIEYNTSNYSFFISPTIKYKKPGGITYIRNFCVSGNYAYIQSNEASVLGLIGHVLKFDIKNGMVDKIDLTTPTNNKLSVKNLFYDSTTREINIVLYPYKRKDLINGMVDEVIFYDSLGSRIEPSYEIEGLKSIFHSTILFSRGIENQNLFSGVCNVVKTGIPGYKLKNELDSSKATIFFSNNKKGELLWDKYHYLEDLNLFKNLEINKEDFKFIFDKPKVINDKLIYIVSLCKPNYVVPHGGVAYINYFDCHKMFVIAFELSTGELLWDKTISSIGKYYVEGTSTLKNFTTDKYINLTIQDGEEIKSIKLDELGNQVNEFKVLYELPKFEKNAIISNKSIFIIGNSTLELNEISYPYKGNKYSDRMYSLKKVK